jgi:hypothetical protein
MQNVFIFCLAAVAAFTFARLRKVQKLSKSQAILIDAQRLRIQFLEKYENWYLLSHGGAQEKQEHWLVKRYDRLVQVMETLLKSIDPTGKLSANVQETIEKDA